MTIGSPPSPTFRSILGGIAIVVILLLAFLSLGNLVKYTGAVLTFVPAKLGIIQAVTPKEVIPVDTGTSPSTVTFPKPGNYSLYTDNYDLLVINDAVVAATAKPWFKLVSNGTDAEVNISLVKRGLMFHDTPFAKGRPVANFTISEAGEYSFIHPIRPATVYFVPDYTTGKEGLINFLMIAQIVILVIVIRDVWGTVRERRKAREQEA